MRRLRKGTQQLGAANFQMSKFVSLCCNFCLILAVLYCKVIFQ